MSARPVLTGSLVVLFVGALGCNSPYHADRGAMLGGLGGAGVGAIVGNAVGHPLAGAAIGAGAGALGGAAIGSGLDEVEARNRAMIEAQMGRQLAAGGTSVEEVIGMAQAGVHEELIVNHIRANGMNRPLAGGDLIALQQQGVSVNVISAMQTSPPRPAAMVAQQPQTVVVHERVYPAYCPPPIYHHHHHRPHVGWGVSFSGH